MKKIIFYLIVFLGSVFHSSAQITNCNSWDYTELCDLNNADRDYRSLESSPSTRLLGDAYLVQNSLPWGSISNQDGMDVVFGAGNWTEVSFNADASNVFNGSTAFVFIEASGGTADLQSYMTANQSLIENWVSNGGHLYIKGGMMGGPNVNVGFDNTILIWDYSQGNSNVTVDTSHPAFIGPLTPTAENMTGNYWFHNSVDGTNITPIAIGGNGTAIAVGEKTFGGGNVVFSGGTMPNFQSPNQEALNFHYNLISYAANGGEVNESPIIQCPVDITVVNDLDECGAIVNFADAVSIDPEDGVLPVVQIAGLASGSQFPVGVSTVTFEATDSGGNSAQCSFTITVEDAQDPMIDCLTDYTVELGTEGLYTLDPQELLASVSDNCDVVSYDVLLTPAQPPVNECASDVPLQLQDLTDIQSVINISESGTISATSYYIEYVSIDITHTWDSDLDISLISPSGTVLELSTDNGGSGDNYTNTVFVDNAPPITSGSAPFTGQFSPEGGTFAATFDGENINGSWTLNVYDDASGDTGTINDFCISFIQVPPVSAPSLPLLTCQDIGTWNLTVIAYDAAGNSASCNTTVTVQDTTAPVIVCDGEPLSGDYMEDFEASTIPAGWSTIVETGNRDWEFGTGFQSGGPDFPTNAATFDDDAAGGGQVNLVRLLSPVFDLDGVETASISFDYALQDFAGAGLLRAEVWDGTQWVEVLFTTVDTPPTPSGDIDVLAYANADFQVRFTYDDEGGWAWSAGVDNFHLTYFAPSSIVQVVLDSNGLANYDASDLLVDVVEGCDYTVTVDAPGVVSGDLTTLFAGGNGGSAGGAVYFDVTAIEDVSLTALDLHTGETGAFTVEVYAIPDGTYIGNENNAGAWTLVATGSGDGQGAGTPSLATLDSAVSLTAGTTYGMALVLSADHAHDYTNGDGTNENYATAELSFSGGSATNVPFTGNVFNPRVFNGRFYYDYLGTTAVENFDFDCSYLGINDIEVTVTDGSGNVSTCISQVEVLDVTDPILVCQDATVSIGENGTAEVLPEYFIDADASFDACGITITAVDVTDVYCSDVGSDILVTVFVSDDSGNIASCQATMTVVDDMAPVLENCPEDMTVDPGAVDLFYEVPDYTVGVTATDNCSDPAGAITQDPPVGTLLPDGVYTVTLSSTDDEGNVGTCSFELTVESVLGVASNQLNAGVAIYPNPARNVMNIGNSTDIQLERAVIYDLNGRMIQTIDLSDMSAEASVNVAHLASGVYMVQLQAQDGQAIKRLVKE